MFNSERRWMDGFVIVQLYIFFLSVQVFFHAVVPHPLPLWTPDKHPGDHHGHSHVRDHRCGHGRNGPLPAPDLLLPPVPSPPRHTLVRPCCKLWFLLSTVNSIRLFTVDSKNYQILNIVLHPPQGQRQIPHQICEHK